MILLLRLLEIVRQKINRRGANLCKVVEIALACSAHQLPEDGLHIVVRAVYEERLTFFAELDLAGHGVRVRRIEHELGELEVSIGPETPAGSVFDASVFFTVCLLL